MKLRLNSITCASHDISLFEFVQANSQSASLPSAEPGSHIVIHLPGNLLRQYSLVNHGETLSKYVIGVKHEDNSRGGSLHMHTKLIVGDELEIDPPRNNFPLLENSEHTVLIAGGIGITPIYCMANRLRELGKSFELYYACRSEEDAIFLEELSSHENATLHFDDTSGTIFDIHKVIDSSPKNSHFYCCGPIAMLESYEKHTTQLPNEQVHLEYFSVKKEAAVEGGFTVTLAQSGEDFLIQEGQTILQVLLDSGLDMPFSCEQGVCGACETKVLEGIPDHHDMILTDSERNSNEMMMICCSGSKTNKLVLDI